MGVGQSELKAVTLPVRYRHILFYSLCFTLPSSIVRVCKTIFECVCLCVCVCVCVSKRARTRTRTHTHQTHTHTHTHTGTKSVAAETLNPQPKTLNPKTLNPKPAHIWDKITNQSPNQNLEALGQKLRRLRQHVKEEASKWPVYGYLCSKVLYIVSFMGHETFFCGRFHVVNLSILGHCPCFV